MSKMKSMLGIALMMSALTEQEHRNNHPMFFDDRETDEGKVNWRTVYGVPDECAEIDEDQIENLKHH